MKIKLTRGKKLFYLYINPMYTGKMWISFSPFLPKIEEFFIIMGILFSNLPKSDVNREVMAIFQLKMHQN